MKDKLVSLAKRGWVLPVICALVLSITAGVVLAAMTLNHQGSVTVVSGGGGGTPPPLTYTFEVYEAETGGVALPADAAVFPFGNVNVSSWVEKTIYVQKTGTGAVTVTPSVTGLDAATGTITFTPTSVTVSDATRQAIVVRFTAGSNPAAVDTFTITYTGNP